MRLIFIYFLLSFVLPYQGELISYEFLEQYTIEEVQQNLDEDLGNISPEVLYDVSMYKIIYNTIDMEGNEVIASGVVAYPANVEQAFPIISWQHGTEVKRDNVSSIRGFNALSLWLTGRGYIYIEPDYLGLGESEILHPYCLKNPSAWTTIDLIRAVKIFCNDLSGSFYYPVKSNNDVILFGYSEGGYVTMATHMMIEQEQLEEFNFISSFPMAGPYDLSGTMADLMLLSEPYGEPFYLPYVVVPYISYYELGSLSDFFLDPYDSYFEYLFDGNYSGGYINSIMPDIPIEVMLPEVINDVSNNLDHPLRLYLTENDLHDWEPQTDMHIFHGIGDELIPYQNSQIAYDNFMENGSENISLYLVPEELGGHSQVAQYCLISAYEICESNYKNIKNLGDLNDDLILNIQDLIIMIQNIFTQDSLDNLDLWASDFDSNQLINIQDIILIVERILEL
jgi:hypothetical protein